MTVDRIKDFTVEDVELWRDDFPKSSEMAALKTDEPLAEIEVSRRRPLRLGKLTGQDDCLRLVQGCFLPGWDVGSKFQHRVRGA